MRTTMGKSLVVASIVSLSLFLTACGTDEEPAAQEETTAAPSENVREGLIGPGCIDYMKVIEEGDPGSFEGMAQDPVATAASNNPVLKTLTAAVSGKLNPDVNLVDTLNGGEFTVFAPVDDAFAKLPRKTVETLGTPEGAETLTSVLTYHVVVGQLAPDKVAGTHKTVNGADLTVEGSGRPDITVGEDKSKVICGGFRTANATVYMIDTVMMPPA